MGRSQTLKEMDKDTFTSRMDINMLENLLMAKLQDMGNTITMEL